MQDTARKYVEKNIVAIAYAVANGVTQVSLGRKLNVSKQVICIELSDFLVRVFPDKLCYPHYPPGSRALVLRGMGYCYGKDRLILLRDVFESVISDPPPLPLPFAGNLQLYTGPLVGKNSRPVDMGGPRDVWLTYRVSNDPRIDNFEPVQFSSKET